MKFTRIESAIQAVTRSVKLSRQNSTFYSIAQGHIVEHRIEILHFGGNERGEPVNVIVPFAEGADGAEISRLWRLHHITIGILLVRNRSVVSRSDSGLLEKLWYR